jgi:hypothetical protein
LDLIEGAPAIALFNNYFAWGGGGFKSLQLWGGAALLQGAALMKGGPAMTPTFILTRVG